MIETTGPTAIYVRISDDPESTRLGVQRQEADCRQLAKRLGWKVIEPIYEDNDLSAAKANVTRPAYERLLKDIQAGTVRRLIIDKPDRLYRRNTELERLIDIVGERVEIRTVKSGAVDLTTVNGRMVARILGATAQAEVETIRERIRRKAQELRANGKFTGGPRPFGWKVEDGEFIEIPAEIRLLEEAKKRVLKGQTIHSIVMDFKARGVTTPRKKHLTDTALATLLTSHRMIGKTAAGVDAPWRALATADEYGRLKALLKTRKRGRPAGAYMVTGELLKCGLCGGGMYGAPTFAGKADPHYCCKTRVNGGCGRIAVQVGFLDSTVMLYIAEHLGGSLWSDPKLKKMQPHPHRKVAGSVQFAEAKEAVGRVQQEMDDLALAVKKGQLTVAQSLTINAGLLARMDGARKQLEAAEAHEAGLAELASVDVQHFAERWQGMDTAARRRVVQALVKEIRVKPHKGAYHIQDFDRVEVDFKPDLA